MGRKRSDRRHGGCAGSELDPFRGCGRKSAWNSLQRNRGRRRSGRSRWSLLAFLHADLKRGIDIVLEAVDFENEVQDADLVITGEGRIDSQTIYGKTPIGVAKAAKSYDVPVIGIAGSISRDSNAVYQHGIDALFSIVPGAVPLEDAFEHAAEYMERTARDIAASIKLAKTMFLI